jgi:hypothetical protein
MEPFTLKHAAHIHRFAAPALLALALAACDGQQTGVAPRTGTFYGDAVALGDGTARSYVVLDDGKPVELGVALGEQAMSGLPTDHEPGGMPMPDGHHTFDYLLPMPAENATPVRFVGLGWNPAGHEPAGTYDLPHFDFHFYTISQAERGAIDPADSAFQAKAARLPEPDFRPTGYMALPGGVPFMGVHWVDPASAELHGQTFTTTFLYGSWNGKLTFAEPMVTRALLMSKPDLTMTVSTAQHYSPAGYYPTSYRVRWDEGTREYRVALAGLQVRQ